MEEQERQQATPFERMFSEADEPFRGAAGGRGGIDFQCVDFCPICRTADVVRATTPPEFQEHWHTWQRELLLALRSLLDHYIEHVEGRRRRATTVEDIPIE